MEGIIRMTCAEQYMKDHPGRTDYLGDCPSTYGYLDDIEECGDGIGYEMCLYKRKAD
jgi:hypothetical protein